jgi:ice-binding like protein
MITTTKKPITITGPPARLMQLLLMCAVGCELDNGGPMGDGAGTSEDASSSVTQADDATSAADGSVDASGSSHGASDGPTEGSSDGPAPSGSVDLGAAGDFVALAKSGISVVPPAAITGDIGVSPAAATFITGLSFSVDATNVFATSTQVTGRVYASDYAAPTPTTMTTAISDMELAFTDAAGRAPDVTELGAGDIGGMTLAPGVYAWSSGLAIGADLTLDGSAVDLWIFQVAGNLTIADAAQMVLDGGATTEHVVWQVAGRVDVGTTAHVEGTVLSQTSITLATGASVDGRLLAQTAISLDGNTIVAP